MSANQGLLSKADEACLARSVLEALNSNPTLEAVTINRARQTISLATLGQADVPRLTAQVSSTIQRAQEAAASNTCTLLTGQSDCRTCAHPLTEQELSRIRIDHNPDVTTIARVTCITAPKFWRWRDLPWPRVVQRDVEFLEEEHSENEWKAQ